METQYGIPMRIYDVSHWLRSFEFSFLAQIHDFRLKMGLEIPSPDRNFEIFISRCLRHWWWPGTVFPCECMMFLIDCDRLSSVSLLRSIIFNSKVVQKYHLYRVSSLGTSPSGSKWQKVKHEMKSIENEFHKPYEIRGCFLKHIIWENCIGLIENTMDNDLEQKSQYSYFGILASSSRYFWTKYRSKIKDVCFQIVRE